MRPSLLKPRRRVNKAALDKRSGRCIDTAGANELACTLLERSLRAKVGQFDRPRRRFHPAGRAKSTVVKIHLLHEAVYNARAEIRQMQKEIQQYSRASQQKLLELISVQEAQAERIRELQDQNASLQAENDALKRKNVELQSQLTLNQKRSELCRTMMLVNEAPPPAIGAPPLAP
ncbi:hypothetical protein SYNPS1DRAFT_21192 [Syncephalis pseudoplumigaleata]|uniref:Uncharacterized protein n=1 Tax=Syncephalis pseudoplumigaleata TaxID=1712513 RepID=A0A4P9Z3V2_9FUNG|nr:hypothetical protein SYNPS1DRAFT_21192 [Syncephalis pseudoplumigaleata]|eukprot:RKP27233.1 hypothetical protein SYNPS1DRAFT_21192 [Syncephalis pseudoplumigaleata]